MNIRKLGAFAAVPTGLLLSGLLVVGASSAAFTAQTSTGEGDWAVGQIQLRHDATGSAPFSIQNIAPGQTGSETITVNFIGSLLSEIRMFASPIEGATLNTDLAHALQLTISADDTVIFNDSLSVFGNTTEFADGLGNWQANEDAARTFTIDWELPATASNNALMGQTASVAFMWEAQTITPAPADNS